MRRRLFSLASLLSLLLCVATVVLWVRSYAHAREISWRAGAMRWTVRAEEGTVGLFSPPYRASNESGATAEVEGLLKTGNVKWSLRRWKSETLLVTYESAGWEQWSAQGSLSPDVARSMLTALENPQTFADAQLALAMRCKTGKPVAVKDGRDGSCVAASDGLYVKLWPGRGRQFDSLQSTLYSATPEIDGGQLPAIRARWNRRLDRNHASILIGLIVAALVVLPVIYCLRIFRSGRWLARGCCPACGLKLTGNTTGACPECGTTVIWTKV